MFRYFGKLLIVLTIAVPQVSQYPVSTPPSSDRTEPIPLWCQPMPSSSSPHGSSSSCRNNNCHENFTLPAWSVGGDWGWQSYLSEDKSLPNIFTLARNNSHYPRCVVHYLALRLDSRLRFGPHQRVGCKCHQCSGLYLVAFHLRILTLTFNKKC